MKALKILLALALVLVMGASLVSCDINPITFWQEKIAPLFHEHEVVIDRGVEPGCVFGGLTEGSHCSTCGEVFKAQVELPALGHDLRHNKCLGCDELFISEGLRYEVLDSERCYITGIGDCTDKDLYIPEYIDGYRVVSIDTLNRSGIINSVYIPEGVEYIGFKAFERCMYLEKVTLSEGLEEIGSKAFYGCENLKSIEIPDSVTKIGYGAFERCFNLTSVVIPDSVTSIGNVTFSFCMGLTSITIPDSITSIGAEAFYGCTKLVEVINESDLDITVGSTSNGYVAYYAKEVHDGTTKIVNIDDYLFYTYDGVDYLLGYVGTDTELTLPESYNGKSYEFYPDAFFDYINVERIVIPDSFTSICDNAFFCVAELKSVVIPVSVTSIGEAAFAGCSNLTDIEFEGTKEQWLLISKGVIWNSCMIGNYTVHCTDGDLAG